MFRFSFGFLVFLWAFSYNNKVKIDTLDGNTFNQLDSQGGKGGNILENKIETFQYQSFQGGNRGKNSSDFVSSCD